MRLQLALVADTPISLVRLLPPLKWGSMQLVAHIIPYRNARARAPACTTTLARNPRGLAPWVRRG